MLLSSFQIFIVTDYLHHRDNCSEYVYAGWLSLKNITYDIWDMILGPYYDILFHRKWRPDDIYTKNYLLTDKRCLFLYVENIQFCFWKEDAVM